MAEDPVLVLDLDGVVITRRPDGSRWDKHLERDLGIRPERLQALFFTPHIKSLVCGECDLYAVLREVWPSLECAATVGNFVDYWFGADSLIDLDLLVHVAKWRAAGRKSFLATNQEHHRAAYVWTELGLKDHFDGMIYSAELGTAKPDPLFFAGAFERLPVSESGKVLFLDDHPPNVEAARAAGWVARHYGSLDDLRAVLSVET